MKIIKNHGGTVLWLCITVYWGLTSVMMKQVLRYCSSETYIFFRFLPASIVLLIIYWNKLRKLNIKTWLRGIIIGVCMVLPLELTVWGLTYTSNANSVFITNLSVVFVACIACILARKRPQRYLVLTIICAIFGVYLMTGGLSGINKGDVISLASAVLGSIGIIVNSKLAKDDDSVMLGVVQIFTATAVALIIWCATGRGSFVFTPHSLLILLLTGVFGTAGCFVLQIVAQKTTPPITISLLSLNISVFGMIGAAIIPDIDKSTELITPMSVFGALVIITGMVVYILCNYIQAKKNPVL